MPPLGAGLETQKTICASQDTCCAWFSSFRHGSESHRRSQTFLIEQHVLGLGEEDAGLSIDMSILANNNGQRPTRPAHSTAPSRTIRKARALARPLAGEMASWSARARPSRDTTEPPGPPGFRHPSPRQPGGRPVPPRVHPVPHCIRPLATLRTGGMVMGTFTPSPGDHSDTAIYTIPVSPTTTLPRPLQPTKSPVPPRHPDPPCP